ncbi:26015_t:CDS:2, partial [Gigaspora rosea]
DPTNSTGLEEPLKDLKLSREEKKPQIEECRHKDKKKEMRTESPEVRISSKDK